MRAVTLSHIAEITGFSARYWRAKAAAKRELLAWNVIDEAANVIDRLRAERDAAFGALSYLRTQARNGTLHPQVVIQNADNMLGRQDA